jgi:hypothetical protein
MLMGEQAVESRVLNREPNLTFSSPFGADAVLLDRRLHHAIITAITGEKLSAQGLSAKPTGCLNLQGQRLIHRESGEEAVNHQRVDQFYL